MWSLQIMMNWNEEEKGGKEEKQNASFSLESDEEVRVCCSPFWLHFFYMCITVYVYLPYFILFVAVFS